MEILGVWIAVALTLMVYTFLYRDNPAYRFAESLFVGVSAGFGVTIAWRQVFIPELYDPIVKEHDYLRLLPGLLGALMLARFHPRTSFLSRWPMAFMIGMYAGITIPAVIQADILQQAKGSMISPVIFSETGAVDYIGSLSNIVLTVGLFAVLAYFFFSKQHTGTYGRFCKLGIYFLMFSFGASFGNTVMARISLLIGRINFLLRDWLHLI